MVVRRLRQAALLNIRARAARGHADGYNARDRPRAGDLTASAVTSPPPPPPPPPPQLPPPQEELLSLKSAVTGRRLLAALRAESCEITTLNEGGGAQRKRIASSRAPRRSFGHRDKGSPWPPRPPYPVVNGRP